MWNIFKYIVKNNPWYAIPYRLMIALFYQIYKRTVCRTFVKQLYNGKKIAIYPFSPNASAFMYTAIPDKTEITLLRDLVEPHTIFLDVGANLGDYSVLLMDKVNNIYAFEAHPETAKLCKNNFRLNGVNEERVIVKAVSDCNQRLHFSNFPKGSPINACVRQPAKAEPSQVIEVSAITLDDFVQSQQFSPQANYLIKIDVEGFEKEVLLGAKKLLTERRISGIILERFSDDFEGICTLLNEWGYVIKSLSKNNVFCTRDTQR